MPAELVTHRRQDLVREVRLTARAEALVQRGGEHGRRYRFVDRRLDSPAPFPRIRYASGELRERGVLDERGRREIEQPRRDHAAAPPYFGDVGKVDVVLI